MNWSAITFDWNQARAFLVTAEAGSFSAAARQLGLTQPTLGRQVAALEEALGLVLFERVGRSLELTQSGRDLLAHVRAMGDAAMQVSLSATGHVQEVAGPVSVSVSDLLAVQLMPHLAERLGRVAPQITLDVVASNRISDLQRREADIAVRHVRPDQPELIARLVRQSPAQFFAASSYLDRVGRPSSLQDLARLDFIGLRPFSETVKVLKTYGVPISEDRVRVTSDSGVVVWDMVRRGLGIMPMIRDQAIGTPGIETVLPEFSLLTVPYWLTVHRELHSSRRIRLVFDLLVDLLSAPVLLPA
ncbi:LysR family transcriptional regulator [Mesobacterium sp. TK19101]|uniref:LysR family transcriptional regulator n=1 Tax=Mesobacterium hydrothermale TaxID=3111907 RepID=A0ABU6HKX3_9RHOB|nr:LysR family transcriptional regulator [Mesobacterium sp. TK19101]MEC3863002.1 LysR family transcriptional regulator [Mesobacterium sp. TK19101]